MVADAFAVGIGWIGWIALSMAALGIVYGVSTLVAFHRLFGAPEAALAARTDGVTLLKPLCGAEPNLEANLRSFAEQSHDGPVQMLCGYTHLEDGAAAAVAALRRSLPAADITTVVSAMRHGPSAKVSNLVNLYREARHPVVVLSDSDMAVGRDYLTHVLEGLDRDGVGAVSLLYHGRGDAGFWSRLAAAGISYQFLPNAAFSVWSSLAAPCMGSTIAIRRELLERIGPLDSFAHHLADDYAIGEAVRRAGLRIHVPPVIITHACAERSFAQLWRREVRWGATVRGVVPARYTGSIITHPLPLAIVGTLLAQAYGPGSMMIASTLLLRAFQIVQVDRKVGRTTGAFWLSPLRDCLSFAVFIASLFARRVHWRGRRHDVEARGILAIDREYPA